MKQPHQGIQSPTQRQQQAPPSEQQLPNVQASPIDNESNMDNLLESWVNVSWPKHGPNIIVNNNDSSTRNIFCFRAFADKRTGILYNNQKGLFLYMSFEGNVCFLVVYHYNPTQSLLYQYQVSPTILSLPRIKLNSNFQEAKSTRLS